MIFNNRPIHEITDQELRNLIGNQEENQNIDFKQQDYHKDDEDPEVYKREICKDITAMANAGGGYILIGVGERDKVAQGFYTVNEASKVTQSIKDTCLDHIDRRIRNLEVELRTFQWKNKDVTLVIIHIPESAIHPHGFKWGGSTNFVKRYGDVTREYPMSELGDAFSKLYYPLTVGSSESDLRANIVNTPEVRSLISSQDTALNVSVVSDLLRLMDLRFDEVILNQPSYRILAVPKELNPQAIDTRDEDIRQTMFDPPDRRYGNFGVTGILEREMTLSSEGIKGPNVTGGEITLLKNGFLEVRCPLRDTQFQWRNYESGIDTEWIYPYVVCEFPVTFLRLVKRIYGASGITSPVFIQQTYHNLEGFTLIGGNPSNNWFGTSQSEIKVYRHSIPIISKRTVVQDFNPEHIAYDMVRDVYDCFGLEEQWIPAFDRGGSFILE